MTVDDAKSLSREAQRLIVEARRGHDSPPYYDDAWQVVWGAKVDRIDINYAARPSVATIWFPELGWHETPGLFWGDMIRIRTDEPDIVNRTISFVGFLTAYLSDFSGGTEKKASAYERNAIVCSSYRWLLSRTSPVYGRWVRGPDDYTDYGGPSQTPLASQCIFASGRRTIFNENGLPNRDSAFLVGADRNIPIFANPDTAVPWTARDMLAYIMAPFHNRSNRYWQLSDPYYLDTVKDDEDWDKRMDHVAVDGLNALEAIDLIVKNIGWSFREDYANDGAISLVFYKPGSASGYVRSASEPAIRHLLHAPAKGENIAAAVAEGRKILWSMNLAEDIGSVVNNPWGLGAPHKFEFTAELVPAWKDSDLLPDTTESNSNLYFTEAELQDLTDPDAKSYYKYYHPRGSAFRRHVGRKWALNESGRYSTAATFDRGVPFDFADVIDLQYILNSEGKRNYGPFNRRLLPCLTVDVGSRNSVGIKVDFSFDGGTTWQTITASISSLIDECGLYIDEANLAELVDQAQGVISGGVLDGVQLNYWTSLCDDKLNGRSFKDGNWKTRVRVTASIQLDQRLRRQAIPTAVSGSPFHHSQIYDFSNKYRLQKRTASSKFASGSLPAWNLDAGNWFDRHLGGIRRENEDMSISGQFTLERLWLGDGAGEPAFALGDSIEGITGREYRLSAAMAGGEVYPEIMKIIYLPDKQKMQLITRDLRFATQPLW
jgi:hypothetical protein